MMRPRTLLPLALALGAAAPADAKLIFNLTQVGSNVVASGSGSANLAGLTSAFTSSVGARVGASSGALFVGPSASVTLYSGATGPSNFGSGTDNFGTGTGDTFGVFRTLGYILLPAAYTSGATLSGTATFANLSFATLGVNTGIYTWTWGSGETADSAELNIALVPEPASLALVAAGLAALGRTRRRRG